MSVDGAGTSGGFRLRHLLDLAIFLLITYVAQQMFVYLNDLSYSTNGMAQVCGRLIYAVRTGVDLVRTRGLFRYRNSSVYTLLCRPDYPLPCSRLFLLPLRDRTLSDLLHP